MYAPVVLDPELVRRHDRRGPRYTSYPPATRFHEDFGEAEYAAAAARSNASGGPLSLYVHIPFCAQVCFYCACNRIVTRNRNRAAPYVAALEHELAMQSELFDPARTVEQLHWGGGTPTFLSADEMSALMAATRRHFRLRDDDAGEYSIEIDPRTVGAEDLALLRRLGFNRVSLGVQDFDPRVQRAVNRVQPEGQTRAVIDAAWREGFGSVSVDLIYGLPHQSVASFERTLERIEDARPDRISVFNYAHLPELFKVQRQIDATTLPGPDEKLRILGLTIDHLQAAGYVYIGMDHFALPEDSLARALEAGTLQRNFQGFSSHADCDLVALGITGIGKLGDAYAQNEKSIERYYERIAAGRLPVARGVRLDDDDCLRREVIAALICNGRLVKADVCADFDAYFEPERAALAEMAADGLVREDAEGIEVCAPGRLLIRNVCMVFDRYLREASGAGTFSKAI